MQKNINETSNSESNSESILSLEIRKIAEQAKQALPELLKITPLQKTQVLEYLAHQLALKKQAIYDANQQDLKNLETEKPIETDYFYDRLKITDKVIEQMQKSILQVAQLKEYIGEIRDINIRPNGLKIGQMRVPIGVLAMIYEARPNVTIEAAILAFKTSNAIILRGGKEAWHTNQLLTSLIHQSLAHFNITHFAVQTLPSPSRQDLDILIKQHDLIDLMIPRGGRGLIEYLMQASNIPMLKHLDGICHVYIDSDADIQKAINIAYNSKCHRYSTCNTMETLIIHQDVLKNSPSFLVELCKLYQAQKVELRVEDELFEYLNNQIQYPYLKKANVEDWQTEYLAPILAIKVVNNLQAAITHINQYGSKHTDSIVTEHYSKSLEFLRFVDSASVMVNVSTRFADGFEYGLGAEIGISNDKLHARGPVGLEGLCSEKYIVLGDGQIRI